MAVPLALIWFQSLVGIILSVCLGGKAGGKSHTTTEQLTLGGIAKVHMSQLGASSESVLFFSLHVGE